jgi:hypothetical protein
MIVSLSDFQTRLRSAVYDSAQRRIVEAPEQVVERDKLFDPPKIGRKRNGLRTTGSGILVRLRCWRQRERN